MAANEIQILVVDDEADVRTLLTSGLTAEQYGVTTASDGEEAIQLIDKNKYDVILLDLKMPRVDGFEVLKHIRTKSIDTKVIIVTAFNDLKSILEVKKLGADDLFVKDVLNKPYDFTELFASIKKVINEA